MYVILYESANIVISASWETELRFYQLITYCKAEFYELGDTSRNGLRSCWLSSLTLVLGLP